MARSRIPLTEDHLRRLQSEKERTGVGFYALLSGKRRELPKGLNSAIVSSWARGKTKTARQSH